MKKQILSMIVVVATVIMLSCSKSGDPTPAQKTALDSVKLAMTSTWKFTSVTVVEISNNKSATTSTCGKSELSSAGFANTGWEDVTPEVKYTYTSSSNSVQFSNLCVTANTSLTFTVVQDSNDTVTITFSNGEIYTVKTKDITSATIKATYSTYPNSGYISVITFARQ